MASLMLGPIVWFRIFSISSTTAETSTRAWVQGLSARECEQVPDQIRSSPRRFQRGLEQASDAGFSANPLLSKFKIADDGCQQVVEVMCDAAG